MGLKNEYVWWLSTWPCICMHLNTKKICFDHTYMYVYRVPVGLQYLNTTPNLLYLPFSLSLGVLRKYYLPNSFLCLVSESEPFTKLYQQMLLTLEPMLHLPFDLSIDFEAKQEEEARLQVARQQQERSRLSASPMPPPPRTSSPEGSPQVRKHAE